MNLVTLSPELRLTLVHAAQRRRATSDGCRFPGRRVVCGCETIYFLDEGRCPTCTSSVDFAAPLYPTPKLPETRSPLSTVKQ